ncbi:MAG: hypothetical protein ACP5RO_06735 [Fervidicoccaceae archaeon]
MRSSANIIAGIIFIIILVVLIFPLFQSYMSSSTKFASNMNQMVGNAITRVNKALSLILYPDGTLVISNGGTSTEKLSYLIINSTGNLVFVPMNSTGLNYLSQFSISGTAQIGDPFTILSPGSYLAISNFPYYSIPVAAVTVDGAIAYVQQLPSSNNLNYNYNSYNYQYGTSYLLNPVTFFTSDLQKEIGSGRISLLDPNLINVPTSNFIASGALSGGVYRLNNINTNSPSNAYPLIMFLELDNATVDIRLNLTGNVINGLNPEWESNPNRNVSNPIFNMLITGVTASNLINGGYFNVSSSSCSFNLTYSSGSWSVAWNSCTANTGFPAQLASWLSGKPNPWRIKMLNLNATKMSIKYYTYDSYSNTFNYVWHNGTQSIGKYYYGGISEVDNNRGLYAIVPQTSIITSGFVETMRFYNINTSQQGKPSTYEPYMIIADTDGNGYPELIFTTEDFTFSYKATGGGQAKAGYTIADTYKGGDTVSAGQSSDYTAVDFTTKPVVIVLSQVSINGTQYMAVNVVSSLYFHDSVYDVDELDTITATDRALFSVMVVDLNNSLAVVSSKNFTYQDLASLESTWPPSTSSFSVNVALPVPYTNHLYEVAVAFWDPYSLDPSTGKNNDEVTLGIEFIGFQLYAR